MPAPAAIFREIHRLRRHAKDLQDQIDRGPRVLKAQQAKVTREEEAWHESQEAVKRLKITVHEKEVSLRAKNQQIDKYKRQLNEVTSKKEYDALQAEINSERKAVQQLEDDILNDMAAVEERAAQVPLAEKTVKQAQDEVAQFEKVQQERLADLARQLEQVTGNLKAVEETLPDDVRTPYVRLVAARGEDSLAPVNGRTCSACYTEITAQNYNEVMLDHFVLCKSCGRILYLTLA